MFDYLLKTVKRLSRQFSDVQLEQYHFEKGCGYRLSVRIYKELMAQASAPAVSNTHNLPALYASEKALVEAFIKAELPHSQAKRTKARLNEAGMAGYRAANGVSFASQVTGNASTKAIGCR